MTKVRLTSLFLVLLVITLISSCDSSSQQKKLSPEVQAELIDKGKAIANQSFKALSGELMKAIEETGINGAVAYCHLQANPIIDSLSASYHAVISRVSDRNRNPANKPDQLDLNVLAFYEKQLVEGQVLQPHLEITSSEVVFYTPIVIQNPLCLLCHGETGSTLQIETSNYIKSIYPYDQATGYRLGDLRGVWKIIFNSEF